MNVLKYRITHAIKIMHKKVCIGRSMCGAEESNVPTLFRLYKEIGSTRRLMIYSGHDVTCRRVFSNTISYAKRIKYISI